MGLADKGSISAVDMIVKDFYKELERSVSVTAFTQITGNAK